MWPDGFSVRLIGTQDCHKCNGFRQYLDQAKYPYEYFDANNPDEQSQSQLDKWMITEMPVLQVLKHGVVIHQFFPGLKSTRTILSVMHAKGAKR